jgi:hypothetical protein
MVGDDDQTPTGLAETAQSVGGVGEEDEAGRVAVVGPDGPSGAVHGRVGSGAGAGPSEEGLKVLPPEDRGREMEMAVLRPVPGEAVGQTGPDVFDPETVARGQFVEDIDETAAPHTRSMSQGAIEVEEDLAPSPGHRPTET